MSVPESEYFTGTSVAVAHIPLAQNELQDDFYKEVRETVWPEKKRVG